MEHFDPAPEAVAPPAELAAAVEPPLPRNPPSHRPRRSPAWAATWCDLRRSPRTTATLPDKSDSRVSEAPDLGGPAGRIRDTDAAATADAPEFPGSN